MNRASRGSTVAVAAVIAVLMSGCAPQVITPPAETVTATPMENRDVVPSPPTDPKPESVWPLTGLSADGVSAEDLSRIAIAVKIDDNIHARPQQGLEFADIVFEEYLGRKGATRLMAVFHSAWPDTVGSTRSLRPMDPNIFGSFWGPIAFSGAASGPLRDARALDQVLFAEDLRNCPKGFPLRSDKVRPYKTYVRLTEIAACSVGTNVQPASQQFDFAYPADQGTAVLDGTPVNAISVEFTNYAHPNWKWDEASGLWQRYEFTKPHMTQGGVQITATNIVILRVVVTWKYRDDPESIMVVDHGTGYVAAGGRYAEIRWSKADRRDTFHLFTLEGEPVYLAPGNTWVELLPQSGTGEVQYLRFDDYVITTSK